MGCSGPEQCQQPQKLEGFHQRIQSMAHTQKYLRPTSPCADLQQQNNLTLRIGQDAWGRKAACHVLSQWWHAGACKQASCVKDIRGLKLYREVGKLNASEYANADQFCKMRTCHAVDDAHDDGGGSGVD
jgi:hypothetical protein